MSNGWKRPSLRLGRSRGTTTSNSGLWDLTGQQRWILSRGQSIAAVGSKPDRLIGVSMDVTAQKQGEEAQREMEKRLADTLASISDAFVAFDRQWRYTYVNDQAVRMLRKPREEMLGRTLWEAFPDLANSDSAVQLIKAMEGGRTIRFEIYYAPLDAWYECACYPSPAGLSIYFQDISERKRDGVLFDVTAKRLAAESLQEADRRKDEFLAMLGHELRNPLAAITTGLRLLRTSPSDEHEWIKDSLERQTRQLCRLVDDLLDVSRITRGKIKLKSETVNLRHAVDRAVESVTDLMAEKRHTLTVTQLATPLNINGDSERLQQIVANLLHNAAKYTDDGGRIELITERQGLEAVIRVRDNGLGIPAEMQSSVFELFGQVESGMHRTQEGLGIGLSLVRMLAELHGGSVGVFSEGLGKGSEFSVRLPLIPGKDPVASDLASVPPVNSENSLDVLIVEDNRDAAKMLAMMLTERGHRVRIAEDGFQALGHAAERKTDVIILDIGLPGMSGYQVAESLRRELKLNDALILAVTGYVHEKDRLRSRHAGIDYHLVKPVDYETLATVISTWQKSGRKRPWEDVP